MSQFDFSSLAELTEDPKLVRFAIIGVLGCLIGAALGELLLAATRPPAGPAHAVCLLIDCSGSMLYGGGAGEGIGQKLHEVKAAAEDFVSRHNSPDDRIAVVGFGTRVHPAAKLTSNQAQLRQAIEELYDGGGTAMDLGLKAAADQLTDSPEVGDAPRSILLFTDGQPDNAEAALGVAKTCRDQKLKIVAIGTGDADMDYLGQITGNSKLVFHTDSGSFDEGFKQAEKAIYGGSLVEASSRSAGFWMSLARTAGWTAVRRARRFVGAGCRAESLSPSPAFTPRSSRCLSRRHRRGPRRRRRWTASLCAGQRQLLAAGHWAAARLDGRALRAGSSAGRSWGRWLAGGWQSSSRISTGAAQRLAGRSAERPAGSRLSYALVLGAVVGAFLGAAILGGAIGLMLALLKSPTARPGSRCITAQERITVTLGADPVRIGGDSRACQVYARGASGGLSIQARRRASAVRRLCNRNLERCRRRPRAASRRRDGICAGVSAARRSDAPSTDGDPIGRRQEDSAAATGPLARPATPAPPGAIKPGQTAAIESVHAASATDNEPFAE